MSAHRPAWRVQRCRLSRGRCACGATLRWRRAQCVCVCMHACVFVCMFVCIYTQTYVCMYACHACMHAYVCVYMHTNIHTVCIMRTKTLARAHSRTHAHTHARTHARTYTHTHTHTDWLPTKMRAARRLWSISHGQARRFAAGCRGHGGSDPVQILKKKVLSTVYVGNRPGHVTFEKL